MPTYKDWNDTQVAQWTTDPNKGDNQNYTTKDGVTYYPIWKNSLTGQTTDVTNAASTAQAGTSTTAGGYSGVEYNYLADILKKQMTEGDPTLDVNRQATQAQINQSVNKSQSTVGQNLANTGLSRSGLNTASIVNLEGQRANAIGNAEVNLINQDQEYKQQALTNLLGLSSVAGSELSNNQRYYTQLQSILAGLNATNKASEGSTSDEAWGNILGQLLNAGGTVGAAAITASDRRLKENIVKIGKSPSGINIYEFNYIGHPKRFKGVMADEVPQASIDINGIQFVDYSKIDVDFEEA